MRGVGDAEPPAVCGEHPVAQPEQEPGEVGKFTDRRVDGSSPANNYKFQ